MALKSADNEHSSVDKGMTTQSKVHQTASFFTSSFFTSSLLSPHEKATCLSSSGTSLAALAAAETPYYTTVLLTSSSSSAECGTIVAALPPSLRSKVSTDDWTVFLERLRPLIQKVQDAQTNFAWISWTLVLLVAAAAAALWWFVPRDYNDTIVWLYSLAFWTMVLVVVKAYFAALFCMRQLHLDELRTTCRTACHDDIFGGALMLECDYGRVPPAVPPPIVYGPQRAAAPTTTRPTVGFYICICPIVPLSHTNSIIHEPTSKSNNFTDAVSGHKIVDNVVASHNGYLRLTLEAPQSGKNGHSSQSQSQSQSQRSFLSQLFQPTVLSSRVVEQSHYYRDFVPVNLFQAASTTLSIHPLGAAAIAKEQNADAVIELWTRQFWPALLQACQALAPYQRWNSWCSLPFELYMILLLSAFTICVFNDDYSEVMALLGLFHAAMALVMAAILHHWGTAIYQRQAVIVKYAPEFARLGWSLECRQVFLYTTYLYMFPIRPLPPVNDESHSELV